MALIIFVNIIIIFTKKEFDNFSSKIITLQKKFTNTRIFFVINAIISVCVAFWSGIGEG